MIRIDSDSHFTPLDAFNAVDPNYGEIGPHFEILPSGRYKVIYQARDSFVPQHLSRCAKKVMQRPIWIPRQGSTLWPRMGLICRCDSQ